MNPLSPVRGEGFKSFRLSDLPEPLREFGVAEFERDVLTNDGMTPLTLFWTSQVQRAAHEPSDRVYYIPAKAWEKVARRWKLDQVAA